MATGGAVGPAGLNLIQATRGASPAWINFYNEFVQNPWQMSNLLAWMNVSDILKTGEGNTLTATILLEGNPDIAGDKWGSRQFNDPKDENHGSTVYKDFQLVNMSESYGEDFMSTAGNIQARNPYGLSNIAYQAMVAMKRQDFAITYQCMWGDGTNKSAPSDLGNSVSPTIPGLDWWSRTGHGGLANTGVDNGGSAIDPDKLDEAIISLKPSTRMGGAISIWMNEHDRLALTQALRSRSSSNNGAEWTLDAAGNVITSYMGYPIRVLGDEITGIPLLDKFENATGVRQATGGTKSSAWIVRSGGYENSVYGITGNMSSDPPQRIVDRQRCVGNFEQPIGLVVPHSGCYSRLYNIK